MIIRETLHTALRPAVLISLLSLYRQKPYFQMANLKEPSLFKNEEQDHHQINSTTKNNPALSLSQLEDEVEKMVACYPFVKLRNYSSEQLKRLDEEQRLTALAWQCLQINDKDKLKKAYQALLPESLHLQFVKRKTNYQGQAIFTAYFQKHLGAMVEMLNSSSATVAEKTCCLNTLVHMRPSEKIKEHLKLIEINPNEKIPMFLVFWVVIKIKNELPYTDNLKKIEEVLQRYQEETTFDAVRMVYTLTLVPYFYRFYSKPIVKGIFLILRQQLTRMNFGDILTCLKKVYQLNSKYSRWLAQDLIALIQKTPSSEDPQVISLIFKLLSYCSVLLVPSGELILYLVSNLPNFRKAIILSGLSQELFVSRLFEESKLDLSLVSDVNSNFVQILQKHLQQELSRLQSLDEIVTEELSCALRMLMNYRRYISKDILQQSSSKIVSILSKQSKDQKVRYGCLECLLSLPFLFQEGLFSIAQQIQIKTKIKQHLETNCQTLIGTMLPVTNINEIINLTVKVQEYRLELQKTPNLCSIRFKELKGYSMDLPTLTNFLSFLVSHKLKQKEELHKIMNELEYIIFSFFNNKLMSFRLTLQVLLLATASEYSNSNLFPKICKALFEILDKYPEFQIAIEDLQFLRENLTLKKRGNMNLDKFLQKCLSDGSKWEKHRQDYLKKQKEFYQREKAKSARKSEGREEYI